MKAVLIRRYGGPEVVEFTDTETPKPGPGQVLVRIRASSVNPIDWKIRTGALKMFIRHPFPMILGVDLAGEVSALGDGANKLAVGDQVYAMSSDDLGANAEYMAIAESLVVKKPSNLTVEEAASVPAVALTALQGLRDKCHLQAGQDVLVNGASGGVGIFAVQLAKVLGAAKITGVCSAGNADFVRGLGADEVIDYRAVDFTAQAARYHVVYDCVGTRTYWECRKVLHRGGSYLTTMASPGAFLWVALTALASRKARAIIVKSNGADLDYLRKLIEEGRVKTVVDRTFPMAEVKEAHAFSQTGRAKGKIVLTLA
jgi:NADPH:quinone reductase-like Zn-dependent oxidoreductase